jgi:hypothetical protein
MTFSARSGAGTAAVSAFSLAGLAHQDLPFPEQPHQFPVENVDPAANVSKVVAQSRCQNASLEPLVADWGGADVESHAGVEQAAA